MIDIGHFALVFAWGLSVYGLVVGSIGAARKRPALSASATNSLYLGTFFCVLSISYLAVAFLNHAYNYVYVWQHSNNTMATPYLISAIWGGMDGSMLLWAVLMSVYASAFLVRSSRLSRALHAWSVPVLSGSICFFLTIVTFLTNPFRQLTFGQVPPDGNGLNPLLQNPSMMIHPPSLYLGFTGFVIPFALCIAALLSGELSNGWITATRRWTMIAWGFLTLGIILGGNWAYIELGWGGFWAWDPVENASFLPWLTGTAYLHSVMVQERRGMLKMWNVSLAIFTYLLTVFGTFLTRSGIVQSVHAFAETDIGWVFLVYLGAIALFSIALVFFRRRELRPENTIESFLSREAVFLFNNLILLAIAFTVLWGVMFPVISEAFTDQKSVVGPPFFNAVASPLFIALLFFMGLGPLMSWRRASLRALVTNFSRSFGTGMLVSIGGLLLDPTRPLAALAFGLAVFVAASVVTEFHRGIKTRRQFVADGDGRGVVALIRRKPRRYGGLIVHFGVAIMAFAITATFVYKIERDVELSTGKEVAVGRYRLELVSLKEEPTSNYSRLSAELRVWDADRKQVITTLRPERRFYFRNEEVTTEVDMRITPREDLYVALAGLGGAAVNGSQPVNLDQATAIMKVFVNPLQLWVWFGGVLMLIGTIVIVCASPFEALAPESADVRRGYRAGVFPLR